MDFKGNETLENLQYNFMMGMNKLIEECLKDEDEIQIIQLMIEFMTNV